jgi:hypothetical protein
LAGVVPSDGDAPHEPLARPPLVPIITNLNTADTLILDHPNGQDILNSMYTIDHVGDLVRDQCISFLWTTGWSPQPFSNGLASGRTPKRRKL